MPHINVSCSSFNPAGVQPGRTIRMSSDELLARRFPDLTMQLHDPALSRQCHDHQATDSSMRFELHSIGDRMIGESGREENSEPLSSQHAACREKFDATLMSAYEQSPTFRRLFNQAWDVSLQHPGQQWRLDAMAAARAGEAEDIPRLTGARRIISLKVEAPHLEGVETYTSEQGDEAMDWDRACLHKVIGALTGLPEQGEEGHPRGAVVEYTNNVLKEMGSRRPACSRSITPAAMLTQTVDAGPGLHSQDFVWRFYAQQRLDAMAAEARMVRTLIANQAQMIEKLDRDLRANFR